MWEEESISPPDRLTCSTLIVDGGFYPDFFPDAACMLSPIPRCSQSPCGHQTQPVKVQHLVGTVCDNAKVHFPLFSDIQLN